MRKKRKKKEIEYEVGSGNVFADLGIANPDEQLAKSQIVSKIAQIVRKRKLSQAKIAKILGISQPKVSLLLRGYLRSFSLERLFRFLNDLGQDVHIHIKPTSHARHGLTTIGDTRSPPAIAALAR